MKMPEDPFALWENKIEIAGESTPDKERALYSVPPGQSSSDQDQDRKQCIKKTVAVVGAIAGIALILAIYAAVKK